MKKCYLFREEHIPAQARFPVIDAHNHLWGKWETVDDVVRVMDEVGVLAYCDLTSNISIAWGEGGYKIAPGDIAGFLEHCVERYPGRFYGFTCANFTQPLDQPLFTDARAFVQEAVTLMRDHVRRGARGLKLHGDQLLDFPQITRSWTEYTEDPAVLERQREQIGNRLEVLTRILER